ncbi:NACHT domain-containing protein [Pontibacter harenae]|uniref:NACHT domain-containing protein n=1 Tax=Pontibacter harenae TaxID=2894083 RepID=UPI001E2A1BFB|nr:NACHT domain-containing protein [Pontibacter harenae]MCC9167986.1 NACHT domain-containing protein [Pontibacter harenae]
MDYLFENLGDERFQEFCSSLVAKEFPNFQSFPVGQPDGGRDSLVYFMDSPTKDFIVFQVKYVRNPNSIIDVHKWLIETLQGEAPKIDKLIPRGAKQFYLLTNVRGTAHLDVGSKDKVNSTFEKSIKIPSLCWWRDDLSRLVEKDPIFKWSFPEILNGQDILNSVLFQNINENKERRESVVKAYLADQFAIDNEVKFRQIDLQNKLLDLFTDVPLRIKKLNQKNKTLKRTLEYFESNNRKVISFEDSFIIEERENLGAASFLLHPKIQNEIQRILLEGGPGQGKSTISQYICQVHRARLLNKTYDLHLLPEHLKSTPVRLPFKIDLRHVAAWVENKNPYQGRFGEEYFSSIWKNSLESFLVGHIVYHSQINEFNSSDLIAIIKLSSVLFVFDGFDEIANLKIREEVIDFINKGINRLLENSKSIQVLITSRPAAFSDTIGFSVDTYPHFELTDITPSITKDYVEKWIKASRLDSREASDIRRLVEEKLEMPHLKDLAKSPMQLAIFISLLRTRGESLPNKRTALYDSYIELFFNRESEKNPTIRDHRDLIIDIHQYLAWVLHSEAELLKNSGSIHIDDLKARLKIYLTKEGHKTDIADQLFHVMEERVCALVSRVQGTYEFEVQPLREYFCAKYLYNTSPYSPAGMEKKGTKPDRFDAIARNFYWHNVVRFFAGCFDKGELPMLIQKLKELQNDEILKYTNYPRLITSQILSDWVFTQYPLLLKDVVKIIVDGINIGNIINQEGRRANNEPILLPNECGRTEVIEECFDQLKKFPHNDYASELIGLIKNNPYQTLEYWSKNLQYVEGKKLTIWLEYAYMLEIIHKIDESTLINIVQKDDYSQQIKKLQILIDGNRLEVINKQLALKKKVLDGVVDSKIFVYNRRYSSHSLQFLTLILHPYLLSTILNNDKLDLPFINLISRRISHYPNGNNQSKLITEFTVHDEIDKAIEAFSNHIAPSLNRNVSEWKNSIEPWDLLVEGFRHAFQNRWSINIVAVIAAGIKSKDETYENFDVLNDDTRSLCKRVRCARMKSGSIRYWENQLDNPQDIIFTLLVLFTWATAKIIVYFFDKLELIISELSSEELSILLNGLSKTARISIFNTAQKSEIEKNLKSKDLGNGILLILSQRFSEDSKKKFIYDSVKCRVIKSEDISEQILDYLIGKYIHNTKDKELLSEVKAMYSSISNYNERNLYYNRHFVNEKIEIPIELAKTIMNDSKSYPRIIASHAERSCRLYANKHLKAVGQIAQDEKWFD